MSRRYLNLIVHDFSSRIYSLCRIDVRKHLFYKDSEITRRAAHPATEKKKSNLGELAAMGGWRRLPEPAINFQASSSVVNTNTVYLFSLLGGESNILYSDNNRHTTLCSLDMELIQPFAPPNSCKTPDAISLPMTSLVKPPSLYVLDLSPVVAEIDCCFEVLSHRNNAPAVEKEWGWDILPPPPFFRNPSTAPDLYSYAVVDGSTICISYLEQAIGTHTFDTYVPELGLWFGLSACKPFSSLCDFDLSAIIDSGQPPKVQHTWDYLDLPEEWSPSQLHLFSLGSGKFCVATFFGTELRTCGGMSPNDSDSDYEDTFGGRECAAFTGLEVKRRDDGEGPLQFIKHMSKRFSVGDLNIDFVL
ncbi:hypothetical protein VPH35_035062 [Triticum aestivum]